MGLCTPLDNNDNSSKYLIMYDKLHQLIPQIMLTLQGQNYPIYVLQVSPSPIFKSDLLHGQLFSC